MYTMASTTAMSKTSKSLSKQEIVDLVKNTVRALFKEKNNIENNIIEDIKQDIREIRLEINWTKKLVITVFVGIITLFITIGMYLSNKIDTKIEKLDTKIDKLEIQITNVEKQVIEIKANQQMILKTLKDIQNKIK